MLTGPATSGNPAQGSGSATGNYVWRLPDYLAHIHDTERPVSLSDEGDCGKQSGVLRT
jgi:hypothetical protein